MPKVVTFGEILLRLSPVGVERLFQSPVFSATFGGGEANVAVSLAHFGLDSWFVTCLPVHAVGDAALRALRAEGVETAAIVRGGERLGIYFAESGSGQRPSIVIYDRARSAITELDSGAVNWARVLNGADWFHVTGITPALGPAPEAAARAAIAEAKRMGIRVSIDLNFRRKLWSPERAAETLSSLARGIDTVIGNEEDLQNALGISIDAVDVRRGVLHDDAYEAAARRVAADYGVRLVAITLRESMSATDNGWSAILWDEAVRRPYRSPRYALRVVDRIGGGDSFAAGLIYGQVTGRSVDASLNFAVAASALKHSIPGDVNRVSVAEIDRLAGGDGSGRVQR
jgi:2-dehydro-3-deoxygluconokinase